MSAVTYTIRPKPRHKTHWQVVSPNQRAAKGDKPIVVCECGGEGTATVIARLLIAFSVRQESSCCESPHVSINATFVTYGYQMDILVNGEPHSVACRDFGGDHDIDKVLIPSFIKHAERAIDAFRKGK